MMDDIWSAVCMLAHDNAEYISSCICTTTSQGGLLIRAQALLNLINSRSRLSHVCFSKVALFLEHFVPYWESRKELCRGSVAVLYETHVVMAHHKSMRGKTRCFLFRGPWSDNEDPSARRRRVLALFCSMAGMPVDSVLEQRRKCRDYAMGFYNVDYSLSYSESLDTLQSVQQACHEWLAKVLTFGVVFGGAGDWVGAPF